MKFNKAARKNIADSNGRDGVDCPRRFGSGLDGETNFLPGAPIQDRRIGDAAEVRGHSRSETRRAAAAGGAARIAPVVHPTRVVARENVLCSEVQYRAVEFVRRADGYAARPVPRREGRCAIEDSCSFPEFAAIISHVELVRNRKPLRSNPVAT